MIKRIVALAVVLCLTAPLLADCTRRVVVRKQIVVQYVPVDRYYSLDPYYQQQALAAQILRQIRAELKKQPAPQGQPAPQPAPQPPLEPAPQPRQEQVAGKYQNTKLLEIVVNRCAKCHGNDSKYTKFLTNDGKALNDLSAGKVWESFGLVNSGEMPKTGDQLADEDVKLFYDWAKNARK